MKLSALNRIQTANAPHIGQEGDRSRVSIFRFANESLAVSLVRVIYPREQAVNSTKIVDPATGHGSQDKDARCIGRVDQPQTLQPRKPA